MNPYDELDDRAVIEERRWGFPTALGIITTAVGAVLVVIGIIVVMRGGLSGPIDKPVVHVAGLQHTPLLGLIEIGAGVLIALAGLGGSRSGVWFCAAAMIVFGVVILAQTDQLHRRLAVTKTHGWWAIGLAALLLITTLVTPDASERTVRRRLDRRSYHDELV